MHAGPRQLLLLALFWLGPSLALAQLSIPLREYALGGSLNDNFGGPALVPAGGTVGSGGYTFSANQGLTLTDPVFNPANYTLELNFSFQDLSGWKKIVDFSGLSSDAGLYSYNGSLQFFNYATSATADFTVNTPVDIVLTRSSATGLVTGYVNGVPVLSFTDSTGAAIFWATGAPLNLFIDDYATSQREAAGGTLNWVRLYNQPLASSDVLALFQAGAPAAVPEPSTPALLIAGLGLLRLLRRAPGVACQRKQSAPS